MKEKKKDALKERVMKRGFSKSWTRSIVAVARENAKAMIKATANKPVVYSGDYVRTEAEILGSLVIAGRQADTLSKLTKE